MPEVTKTCDRCGRERAKNHNKPQAADLCWTTVVYSSVSNLDCYTAAFNKQVEQTKRAVLRNVDLADQLDTAEQRNRKHAERGAKWMERAYKKMRECNEARRIVEKQREEITSLKKLLSDLPIAHAERAGELQRQLSNALGDVLDLKLEVKNLQTNPVAKIPDVWMKGYDDRGEEIARLKSRNGALAAEVTSLTLRNVSLEERNQNQVAWFAESQTIKANADKTKLLCEGMHADFVRISRERDELLRKYIGRGNDAHQTAKDVEFLKSVREGQRKKIIELRQTTDDLQVRNDTQKKVINEFVAKYGPLHGEPTIQQQVKPEFLRHRVYRLHEIDVKPPAVIHETLNPQVILSHIVDHLALDRRMGHALLDTFGAIIQRYGDERASAARAEPTYRQQFGSFRHTRYGNRFRVFVGAHHLATCWKRQDAEDIVDALSRVTKNVGFGVKEIDRTGQVMKPIDKNAPRAYHVGDTLVCVVAGGSASSAQWKDGESKLAPPTGDAAREAALGKELHHVLKLAAERKERIRVLEEEIVLWKSAERLKKNVTFGQRYGRSPVAAAQEAVRNYADLERRSWFDGGYLVPPKFVDAIKQSAAGSYLKGPEYQVYVDETATWRPGPAVTHVSQTPAPTNVYENIVTAWKTLVEKQKPVSMPFIYGRAQSHTTLGLVDYVLQPTSVDPRHIIQNFLAYGEDRTAASQTTCELARKFLTETK